METTTAAKKSVYQIVTDRIVELLKQGTVPWKKPWADAGLPMNLVSKRQYKGINVMLLNSLSYDRNLFITAKQLKELGARYKKGEKPYPVVYWKWRDSTDVVVEGEKPPQVAMLRYYSVFNVDQCEGIPDHLIPPVELREVQPIPACEALIANMPNLPEIKHKEKFAYYNPLTDIVNMPKIESFETDSSYYSTLLHELVHSTGHRSRLDRKGLLDMSEYTSDNYSFEELVAELGAAFLESHCGLEVEFEQNAAYIQGWIKRFNNDNKFIVWASTSAQKAANYILGVKPEQSTEEETEE